MQWLTAILAFATTMLIFSVVVTTMVETIHRAIGSRTIGLQMMLRHIYEQVIKQHLSEKDPELKENEFIEIMSVVRSSVTPTGPSKDDTEFNKLNRYSFKRLSHLPTATFMKRLGTSRFSSIIEAKKEKELLLKDIAQKYETFGEEAGFHFESKARLVSVVVDMFVAWIFYVHPYNLIQTYLKNPEVAEKIALLADETMDRYEERIKATEKLRKVQAGDQTATSAVKAKDLDKPMPEQHSNLNAGKTEGGILSQNEQIHDQAAANSVKGEDLNELMKELRRDLEDAKSEVGKLSQAGAAIGWPNEDVCSWPRDDSNDKPCDKPSDVPVDTSEIKFYWPKSPKDIFWLMIGGLLIGLGAPFWAKLIGQLTQVQSISGNVVDILKPQRQAQSGVLNISVPADKTPVTSEAFEVAASASKLAAKNSNPSGKNTAQ